MLDFIGRDKFVPQLAALKPKKVAGYVTGSPDILWTLQEWDMFPDSQTGKVRIDQSPGLQALATNKADVGDVESRAGTIRDFINAALIRRDHYKEKSTIYIQASNANEAHAECQSAGILDHVLWWIADWNLSEQEATARLNDTVVAVQYASPTSNPNTVIPGSLMRLADVNVDLSVTRADWIPPKIVKLSLSVTPVSIVVNGGWSKVSEADHYVIADATGKVLARTVDNHVKALVITPGEAIIVHAIVHSKAVLVGTWQMR
jgi:hypothetical protein